MIRTATYSHIWYNRIFAGFKISMGIEFRFEKTGETSTARVQVVANKLAESKRSVGVFLLIIQSEIGKTRIDAFDRLAEDAVEWADEKVSVNLARLKITERQ